MPAFLPAISTPSDQQRLLTAGPIDSTLQPASATRPKRF